MEACEQPSMPAQLPPHSCNPSPFLPGIWCGMHGIRDQFIKSGKYAPKLYPPAARAPPPAPQPNMTG